MLTGKIRYRVGFRGKLIIQAEYFGAPIDRPVLRWQPIRWVTHWRDAKVEDMQDIAMGNFSENPPLRPGENPPPKDRPSTRPSSSKTRKSKI